MRASLVALLVASTFAPAILSAAEREVEISAELLESSRGGDTIVATGDARVRSGRLVLRAPELEYRRIDGRVFAERNVVAVDGLRLLTASRLELEVETGHFLLRDGRLVVKRGVKADELRASVDGGDEDVSGVGIDALTVQAMCIEQEEGSEGFTADRLWLTTCECPGGGCRPLLSISARSADVIPGDRALLRWGWLRIFDVPLIPLPRFVLPLSDRRSGLLMPRPILGGPGGMAIEQPLFITLGESADVTLRGRLYRGTEFADEGGRGVRGPGAELEFRWRPAEQAEGSLRWMHLYDTSLGFEGEGIRGHRGELALIHQHALGGGRLAVDVAAVSDNSVLRDGTLDLKRSELPYLRSTAGFSRPMGTTGFAFQSGVVQNLLGPRQYYDETFGTLSPVGRGWLHGHRSYGKLFVEGTASLLRESVLPGFEIEEGRGRRTLASANVSQTFPLWSVFGASVAFESGQRAEQVLDGLEEGYRAGGFAGLRAQAHFARAFSGGWVHDIRPSVRMRGFASTGSLGWTDELFAERDRAPQSELDMALPPGFATQFASRVTTTLARPGWRALDLMLEHRFGVAPVDRGQLELRAGAGLPESLLNLQVTGQGVYDLATGGWTAARGRVRAGGKRGELSVGAMYIDGAGNAGFGQGLDMLFATAAGRMAEVDRILQYNARAGLTVLRGLRAVAGYDRTKRLPDGDPIHQYSLGANYDAGGCARMSLMAIWTTDRERQILFTFDLGDVGSALGGGLGKD